MFKKLKQKMPFVNSWFSNKDILSSISLRFILLNLVINWLSVAILFHK